MLLLMLLLRRRLRNDALLLLLRLHFANLGQYHLAVLVSNRKSQKKRTATV